VITAAVLCFVCSVLLQDINTRKPFRSSVIKDQQVTSLATRPLAIAETYHQCEPPPALQKLNPYRSVSLAACSHSVNISFYVSELMAMSVDDAVDRASAADNSNIDWKHLCL